MTSRSEPPSQSDGKQTKIEPKRSLPFARSLSGESSQYELPRTPGSFEQADYDTQTASPAERQRFQLIMPKISFRNTEASSSDQGAPDMIAAEPSNQEQTPRGSPTASQASTPSGVLASPSEVSGRRPSTSSQWSFPGQAKHVVREPNTPRARPEGDLPDDRRANVEILAELFQDGAPVEDGLLDYILLKLGGDEQTAIFKAIEQEIFHMPDSVSQGSGHSVSDVPPMLKEIRDIMLEMRADSQDFKGQFGSLERSIATFSASVSDLESTVTGFTTHITGLEGSIKGLERAVVDLKEDLASLKESNRDTLMVLTALKNEVTSVRFGLSNMDADVKELKQASSSVDKKQRR